MSRITQLNFIGQAHLLPGLSSGKLKEILTEQKLSDDADAWTTEEIEEVSNRIMEVCTLALPEVVGWVADLGGRLEAREGGQLAVKKCRLPEDLRRAIRFHKERLHLYVSAFPGGCWPTKGGDEALNVNK
jgi:hypothetical protein